MLFGAPLRFSCQRTMGPFDPVQTGAMPFLSFPLPVKIRGDKEGRHDKSCLCDFLKKIDERRRGAVKNLLGLYPRARQKVLLIACAGQGGKSRGLDVLPMKIDGSQKQGRISESTESRSGSLNRLE